MQTLPIKPAKEEKTMLKKRRYILTAAIILLLMLLGMLLYDVLSDVRTGPRSTNGTYFVMQEAKTHGRSAL